MAVADGPGNTRYSGECRWVAQSMEHAHEFGEMVLAAAQTAFSTNRAAAVLVSQRVIGAKDFEAKEEHQ